MTHNPIKPPVCNIASEQIKGAAVHRATDDLNTMLLELGDVVNALHSRLDPILPPPSLLPELNQSANKAAEDGPVLCLVARTINGAAEHAAAILEHARFLLANIQV